MREFFNDYVQTLETYIMFRIKETVAKITPELTAKGRAPISLSMGAPIENVSDFVIQITPLTVRKSQQYIVNSFTLL